MELSSPPLDLHVPEERERPGRGGAPLSLSGQAGAGEDSPLTELDSLPGRSCWLVVQGLGGDSSHRAGLPLDPPTDGQHGSSPDPRAQDVLFRRHRPRLPVSVLHQTERLPEEVRGLPSLVDEDEVGGHSERQQRRAADQQEWPCHLSPGEHQHDKYHDYLNYIQIDINMPAVHNSLQAILDSVVC